MFLCCQEKKCLSLIFFYHKPKAFWQVKYQVSKSDYKNDKIAFDLTQLFFMQHLTQHTVDQIVLRITKIRKRNMTKEGEKTPKTEKCNNISNNNNSNNK